MYFCGVFSSVSERGRGRYVKIILSYYNSLTHLRDTGKYLNEFIFLIFFPYCVNFQDFQIYAKCL